LDGETAAVPLLEVAARGIVLAQPVLAVARRFLGVTLAVLIVT